MKICKFYLDLFYHRKWWVEGIVVAVHLLVVALVFTFPLVLHLTEAIPAGSEPPTIAVFQLFTTEWTGTALDEGLPYLDTPYFYPYKGVFAWSDPQILTGILVWLAAKITGYILAYNLVILFYLVGTGLSGYAMARLLTRDRFSSLWCGIWLTAGAYPLQQICVPLLVAVVFPVSCIIFGFLFLKDKRQVFLWAAVISYVFTWLSCEQYGYFLTFMLPLTLLPCLLWGKWRRLTMLRAIMAVFVALGFVWVYSLWRLPYLRQMGFERMLGEVRGDIRLLALSNLFTPAKGHWLITRIMDLENYSWSIGVVPLLVIVLSVFAGAFKSRIRDAYQKRIVLSLMVMIIVALFLGLGPKTALVIKGKSYSLYALFFSIVPGFCLVRSPARLGVFVTVGVAVFSAWALAFLKDKMKTGSKRVLISSVLFIFLFAEMWTMPVPLVFPADGVSEHQGVINWLREHGKGKPVLELPLCKGLRPVDNEPEVWAIYRMLRHRNPIVNGYSSYFPVSFKQLKEAMNDDPAGRGRRYIDAHHTRYVLVHKYKLDDEQRENLHRILGQNVVYDDQKHSIYLLPEREVIGDIEKFLPLTANFKKEPERGQFRGVTLPQPVNQTILILPRSDWRIEFTWQDEAGEDKTKKVYIAGSVLLDVEHPLLCLEFISFPPGEEEAKARLVPFEWMKYLLQKHSDSKQDENRSLDTKNF